MCSKEPVACRKDVRPEAQVPQQVLHLANSGGGDGLGEGGADAFYIAAILKGTGT